MHAIQVIKDKQDTQWQIASAVLITRTLKHQAHITVRVNPKKIRDSNVGLI